MVTTARTDGAVDSGRLPPYIPHPRQRVELVPAGGRHVDAVNITVIVNGHREGLLIHRTLRSVLRSTDLAAANGIQSEILVVLDRPDDDTAAYFARSQMSDLRVIEVDCGDPGLARNIGVREARGEYVAFVDGDDLISGNWLTESFAFYERNKATGRRLVLHPESSFFFGADWTILPHVDQESAEWHLVDLFSWNYWTALSFARRDDVATLPYRSAQRHSGFAYEDWDWNCQAVGAGLVHKVVARTWHFIRAKEQGSRNLEARWRHTLVRPSQIFDLLEQITESAKRTDVYCAPDAARQAAPTVEDDESDARRFFSSPELMAEWSELARIDPDLFPSNDRIARYRLRHIELKRSGVAFGELLKLWGKSPTHVLLCSDPGANSSGRLAVRYARALAEIGADVTLVVCSGSSGWTIENLGEAPFRWVDLPGTCGEWDARWLLARVILQRPPPTIHVIDTQIGYQTIAAYGAAITQSSKIFATLSTTVPDEDADSPLPHFTSIMPFLEGVLSDRDAVLDWICETYGLARERCHRLPLGVETKSKRRRSIPRVARSEAVALWVGAMDRRSCPGMLLRLAQLMPHWKFLIWTEPDAERSSDTAFTRSLAALPNIVFTEANASFDEVSAGVNAVICTSLTDHLSDSLVEAVLAAIPLIMPSLRGVTELLEGEHGFFVDGFDRPEGYAQALRAVEADAKGAAQRARKLRDSLRARHAWHHFVDALRSINDTCN